MRGQTMSRCVWTPLMFLAVIVVGLAMTIWGVSRNSSSAEEKQKKLAALFGGWPPTKGNAFLFGRVFWRLGTSELVALHLPVSQRWGSY